MTDNETNGESSTGSGDNIPSALDELLIAQLHADSRAAADGKPPCGTTFVGKPLSRSHE